MAKMRGVGAVSNELGIVEAARLRTRSRITRPACAGRCTGKGNQAMNRHERRKAKALSRLAHKNHGPTVVAVHEAGHAVAKVLAIGELGYSVNEAIKYIDMGSNERLGAERRWPNGDVFARRNLRPTFSKQIEEASREFKQAYLSEHEHGVLQGARVQEFLSQIVALGRAAGADTGK